jgi:hypothetical protein
MVRQDPELAFDAGAEDGVDLAGPGLPLRRYDLELKGHA